jgi:parvulin-like peptidyl-prolyl isomerase
MDRKHRKFRHGLAISISVLVLAGFLALGTALVLRPSILGWLTPKSASQSAIDAEVERLKSQTPELFTEQYGNVSEEELRARIEDSIRDRDLLVAEARRRGITDVSEKTDSSLDAIRSQYAGNGFADYLAEKGVTEKQLKASIEANLIIAELAKALVKESDITEDEARAYFEENRDKYVSNASKKVAHILFGEGGIETARAVRAEIETGKDFATLAKKHSKDTGSASRGGDIGWSTSTYPKAFQKAVDRLKTGEVSDPVATEYGIHLIKVLDTKAAQTAFEDVKEQVVTDLLNKRRGEAIEALLKQLR